MVTKRTAVDNDLSGQVEETARLAESLQEKEDLSEVKNTQIIIRCTEDEKDDKKAFFAKHGLSVSKGMNIAYEVLRILERKGKVELTRHGYSMGL